MMLGGANSSVHVESPYTAEPGPLQGAGPHPCGLYPPYAPIIQCPNPYVCSAQGQCAGGPHHPHPEYAARGYPPQQMSTPTRHAVYAAAAAAAAHHHPYYYDSAVGPYPHYVGPMGPYHYPPAPPGAAMNASGPYYEHHPGHPAGLKYHPAGTGSGPLGRPMYPPYASEHYGPVGPGGEYGPAALHPYHIGPPHGHPYDESP